MNASRFGLSHDQAPAFAPPFGGEVGAPGGHALPFAPVPRKNFLTGGNGEVRNGGASRWAFAFVTASFFKNDSAVHDSALNPNSEVAGVISGILTTDLTDCRMHQTGLGIISTTSSSSVLIREICLMCE